MANDLLCSRNLVIVVVIVLVVCYLLYSSKNTKEMYTAGKYDTLPIDNSGITNDVSRPLSNYMNSGNPTVLAPLDAPMSDDVSFARSFMAGEDHERYEHLYNNPENVLNQRSRPVELAPNVDLPLGAGPEAFNAQRHEYRRLRRHLGYHNRLYDTPAFDLFGSAPSETLFVNASTGRPLQSMFNNSRDTETGILARLDRIKSRRDFEEGDHSVPVTVPGSGVGELPVGASFSPVTATLQLHDEREIQIPEASFSQAVSNENPTIML